MSSDRPEDHLVVKIKQEVLSVLEQNRDLVAQECFDALRRSHPLYMAIEDSVFLGSMLDTFVVSLTEFASWASAGLNELTQATSAYYRRQGSDAGAQLIPLEAIHEPVQAGIRFLWRWIVRECGDSDAGRVAALDLVALLYSFGSSAANEMTAAYTTRRFRVSDEGRAEDREIIDALLAGRPLETGQLTSVAAGFELTERPVMVSVTVPVGGISAHRLAEVVDILEMQHTGSRYPIVARDFDIVAVFPVTEPVEMVVRACRDNLDRLRRIHGIDLATGMSTIGGLRSVPSLFLEAKVALRFVDPTSRGAMALSQVRLFDYLASRFDDTAERIVPGGIRLLIEEDERSDGSLRDTLRALADHDLNVGRAARALMVHPNTVHYRLKRVADLSGLNPKRFGDLADLLVALRGLSASD